MRKIHVTIKRKKTEGDSYRQTYCTEFLEEETVSIMNVLEYIYQNLDDTLVYFSHAACKQAACGKCMVRVDGMVCLACKTEAKDGMVIEPYNRKVVRDLMCRS